MSRMIFVNLPVTDLDRAVTFYEGIGGTKNPQFSNEKAACIVFSDTINVMLLTHKFYSTFTRKPIADPHTSSAVLLALSCDSKTGVDAMVDAAAAHGGKADPAPKQDFGFMYGRSFEDPDGNHWEPNWMDMSAVPKDMAATAEA